MMSNKYPCNNKQIKELFPVAKQIVGDNLNINDFEISTLVMGTDGNFVCMYVENKNIGNGYVTPCFIKPETMEKYLRYNKLKKIQNNLAI